MRRQVLGAALGALLCACGGSTPPPARQPSEPILPEESAGDEADSPAQGAAPPSGPATLKVVTKLGSAPVAAHIKVFGEGVSIEGKSGEPLAVRAGDLEIEATLSDSKALHGSETVHRSITVEAGAEKTETVIFERSLARVEVRIHGKLDSSAVVTLSKDGATVAKLKSGDKDYVAIAPGRYNASVKSQRAEITSSDITLNEGATQTIPLDVK